ncbi:MAG: endonuclease/exonuclease/phosphatase family protein [Halopseudomonas aestusnigri]
MKFCSYNIQYGIGKDELINFDRIVAEIGSQDVICLQEVERFLPETDMGDQVGEFAARFPTYHWVYGPGVDVDADLIEPNGHVRHRRRQFGNMLLSKTPILSSRSHVLPKHGLLDAFSLQRSLLEGVINTPSGPLRVFSTHFSHCSPQERGDQARALLDIIRHGPAQGGSWSGNNASTHWTDSGNPPPMPHQAIVMGDFNMTPLDAEYDILVGPWDIAHGRLSKLDNLVDAWDFSKSGSFEQPTCTERAQGNRPVRSVRLDYAFVTPELAPQIMSMSVNVDAQGSDHEPIFVELEL